MAETLDKNQFIIQKICIGTVQFGIPYGINNSVGLVSSMMISQIFKIANENNISFLDTAIGYGDAENRIAELSDGKFKIITKFSSNNEETLINELYQSFQRLNVNFVYGYIAHNADILLKNNNLYNCLLGLKEKGLIKKIGYSLYTPDQLEKLLELNFLPDLVQIPYSLLDRKFEKYFPLLKSLGVEIHVRSVFLQGLYFMDPFNLPVKLKDLRGELQQLQNSCNDFGVSIGALALNFTLRNSLIDKVVIGLDNPLQLTQNINSILSWNDEIELLQKVMEIDVKKKELLNPVNWN